MPPFVPSGLLVLASDFGLEGPYVGQMKGAALAAAPVVRIVDLWHGIPPQAVRVGAFLLPRMWDRFPAGTVHVAVVDPGVGTDRGALAVHQGGRLFLGPDNGLFTGPLGAGGEARRLPPAPPGGPPPSATFHGRDLFAPLGALMAAGSLTFSSLEPPATAPVLLDLPRIGAAADGTLRGEVVWVDRFGNALTSLPADRVPPGSWRLQVGDRFLPGLATYGQVEPGALLAHVGSFGLVEVACRDGSAAELLGLRPGMEVGPIR